MKAKLFLLVCALAVAVSAQAITITIGAPYSQDFNTLASSGTSSNLPSGWAFVESGSSANTTYAAGTGSSSTGNTYSFGAAGSTERAFGMLRSGSLVSTIGVMFQNGSLSSINLLEISYTGEQWRLGALGRQDRMDFQYRIGGTDLMSGTWVDFNPLDFIAPKTTGSVGALNGNDPANRTLLSDTILNLNIAPGDTFWLRWTDFDAAGADDGLAIDDFSLTARSVPDGGTTALLLIVPLLGLFTFCGRRLRPSNVS